MDTKDAIFKSAVRAFLTAGLVSGTLFGLLFLGLIGVISNLGESPETQAKLWSGVVFVSCVGMFFGAVCGSILGLLGGWLIGFISVKSFNVRTKKTYRFLIGISSVLYGFGALVFVMWGLEELLVCVSAYEASCSSANTTIAATEFLKFNLIPAAVSALVAAFTAQRLVKTQQKINLTI